MAGIQIQSLPNATTLTGAEQTIVNQGNVTKKSTIDDINAAPLAAAAAAQATADSAQTTATSAASAASAASTAASNAQSTANSKLSSVSVDGTTITGNGTSGNPLVANVPTTYQQLTKSAFLSLVGSNGLVVGKSYLVENAYVSSVFGGSLYILVTAISNNDISQLSWVKFFNGDPTYNSFAKCRTDVNFSFMRLYETDGRVFLNQSQCQTIIGGGVDEFVQGCEIFVFIGGEYCKTYIGDSSSVILTKNVVSLERYGVMGEIDINADTFTPYSLAPYKVYTALITQSGTSAPVATVLQNTFSGSLTWSYVNTGIYRITSSSNEFVSNKTSATCSITNYQAHNIFVLNSLPTSMELQTLSTSGGGFNGMLTNSVVEIRVYN